MSPLKEKRRADALLVERGLVPSRAKAQALILAGGALNVVVCALYLTVSGVGPWVLAIRVAHGLAEALMFAALFTYAADHVPASRRTEGLALFGVRRDLPYVAGATVMLVAFLLALRLRTLPASDRS